jgi:hypothetical protein
MTRACFKKKGSNPPMCGVHNVPLIQQRSFDDSASAGIGDFTFLVCPVSSAVVNDE